MAGIIEIRCDRCGYRQRLTERCRQYRFPDRATAPIDQALAWCSDCRRVVEAERLPGVPEIEGMIAHLQSAAGTAAKEVGSLVRLRAWRLGRRSPPKCLECGSASAVAFPQDEEADAWLPLPHPGCGGRLGVGCTGLALTREWPLPQYSPEGDFLTALLTEAEWHAWADPAEMLKHLEVSGRATDRKLRLFSCACCRRVWGALPGEASRRAVEVSERYADRQVEASALREAKEAAEATRKGPPSAKEPWAMYADYAAQHASGKDAWEAFGAANSAECAAMWHTEPLSEGGVGPRQKAAAARERRSQCDVLRDIFGPLPFRAVSVDSAWRSPAVLSLAQAIYDARDFDRLPELADALEAADCDNADLLGHLRGPGPHTLGCFALDLVLGKE